MASSSIPNDQFASGFVTLIGQFKANTITAAAFTTQLTGLVDEWDAYTPAQLAASVNSFVTNQRVWQKELRDWWGGTVNGGPNGDGLYPFTSDLGVTALAPCPALVQNPVLGPAGQASNAAVIAQTAANTALAAAAGINANTTLIAQNVGYAQANAGAAAGSASSAAAANTSAWTAKAGADSAKSGADTANTNAQAARVAAQANAIAAAGSASSAATANTSTWTAKASVDAANASAWTAKAAAETANTNAFVAKIGADTANTSAWLARTGAASSEANALTSRNTTLTYVTQAQGNAVIAVGNAVAAAASSNTATTRAIAAETAQAGAETALAQARTYANVALIAAANAAASVGFNIADYQLRSEKGAANGYASLDTNGKVPIAQLDTVVLGGLKYMGTWNASTNSPTIPAAAISNKGQYYKVGTAGTTNVGGYTDWQIGDWVLSDGTIWDKIDNTDQVQSVAGRTGTITLTKSDVGLSAVDNTSDLNKPVSNATIASLILKLNTSDRATLTEALVGTEDSHYMTPAKTAAAIGNAVVAQAQVIGLQTALDAKLSIASKANTTQAIVGTDDVTWMTPAKTASAITDAITSRTTSVTYSLIAPAGLASANAVGVANVAAREDHVHQFPLARISNAMTSNASLTLADHGGVVEWGSVGDGTITLPNSLPAGFNCLVRVISAAGVPTFAAAAGATIRQADARTKARKQWSEVSVSVRGNATGAVAEYVLSGDMA
jgi:hypothetical protein